MEQMTRRGFTRQMIGSLLSYSLVTTLSKAQALGRPMDQAARPWVLAMEHETAAMRAGTISQKEWQARIEEMLARIDMAGLLRAIDYDNLVRRVKFQERHESVLEINLPKREGLKGDLSFDSYFYAMKKGVAIVPHGHRNMTTMHMVLTGEAQALHYDRVTDDRDYIVIKPVSDILAKRGDASTISDESTNIHWFRSLSDTVFMFNIGVYGINPKLSFTGREYLDPLSGQKTENGLIRARRLNQEEAYRVYGKSYRL
jgi:hypothetical protein